MRLANAEHQAQRGEVVIDGELLARLADRLRVSEQRYDEVNDQTVAVVQGFAPPHAAAALAAPWPILDAARLPDEQVRVWLLPQVYERLRRGLGNFLAELRPTVALFVRFTGIDYDNDDTAGGKLDAYIRWVQGIVARYEGTLIDLNIGDKGSYLYINFGAPLAHEDNADRAAAAALLLQAPPENLAYIEPIQIGISQGQRKCRRYGGTHHRTYGVLGDEVNMAARLMMAAQPGQTVMSEAARRSLSPRYVGKSASFVPKAKVSLPSSLL
ncbi:MAG: adenylate/guanylate cyclase domain-containing protein [Caldilineaceae bacterium]